MKKWLHISFVLIISAPGLNAQNFDDFTLDKEVSIFIKENFDGLKNFSLGIDCPHEENQWYLDSLEYSPWYVGDFNKDKISDLFVTGKQRKDQVHYLIFGKDELDEEPGWEYLQLYPSKKRGDLVIPFIEETRKQLYIVFKQFKTSTTTVVKDGLEVRLPKTYKDYYKMGLMKKDTLIYEFGHIVEYNAKPEVKPIKFLQIHIFCQFGGCPDFRVKLSNDGQMILHNINNTTEETGMYTAVCEPDLIDRLFALANYLKINKQLEKFGDDSADKTVTMLIEYEDGSYKSWYDYEQGASLAMARFYELMVEAKNTAEWELKGGE
ncbi:MAG: hypothetical protein IPM34_14255 [Saprospiraceae bacterium]|nr:hypothetical protein [Saprospiraceae bacterium]